MERVQRLSLVLSVRKALPFAVCMPDIERAIKLYLVSVKEAGERSGGSPKRVIGKFARAFARKRLRRRR